MGKTNSKYNKKEVWGLGVFWFGLVWLGWWLLLFLSVGSASQNCTESVNNEVNITADGVPVASEKLKKIFLD